MSFEALLLTTYILFTVGAFVTTVYGMVDINYNVNLVVPIAQGIISVIIILYDSIILYMTRKNNVLYTKILICTILVLSSMVHIVLFSITLDYTLHKYLGLLPFIYSASILSWFMDFITYIVIYRHIVLKAPPEVDGETIRLL